MSHEGELPPVCILAGGLGARLGELVREVPKPLLPVAGEPFLMHQLRLLSSHGATKVVLCVGYLGELIERTIGRERFGIDIDYSYDGPYPIGTLAAVRKALPLLGSPFLVLYGDTYLRMDYRAAWHGWQRSRCAALMAVLKNDGQWDTSNVVCAGELVVSYDKYAPTPEMSWIDYGLGGLTERALESVGPHDDLALLYHALAEQRQLYAYEVSERFFEIGSARALRETDRFLRSIEASVTHTHGDPPA